jgi:PII-like signaling protein
MLHRFRGERTLMRIFIGESDRYEGRPLYERLVQLFRERGFAGATVLRGVSGFGAHATTHTEKILRLSLDLPIVIEVVETQEALEEILPELDRMIDGGLITMERARVILYRAHDVADTARSRHRIEGLSADDGPEAGTGREAEAGPVA